MENPIIAVIDIGSNSIRLQITQTFNQTYKVIDEYKETVRIGDNVFETGEFSDEAIDTIYTVLKNMKSMMDSNRVEFSRIVATASFREARNAEFVVEHIKEKLDLNIEIISGLEEARIMTVAVGSYFQMNEGNILLLDMGGGSTEFSYFENGKLKLSETTPLGASKLTSEFFKTDPVKTVEVADIEKYINDILEKILPTTGPTKLICAGGSINNIAHIFNKRKNLGDSTIKFVDKIFLKHFINEIVRKSIEERLKISGMELLRADMILSASMLVNTIVDRYRLDGFLTMSGGLRVGLTIDLINKVGYELLFQGGELDVRYSRIIETARKYNYEEKHALHVTKIADLIFKQVKDEMKLEAKHWYLLEAASILHDVGQYIAYSKHHKHSYYLITNTELIGYNLIENEIIANVARYHRRDIPKKSHKNFAELTAKDQQLVIKLSSILRIADAMDRSHAENVKDIKINISKSKIEFNVIADGDIGPEKDAFEKKKDLFQSYFNKEVVIV